MKIKEYKEEITSEIMDLLLIADPDKNAVLSYLSKSKILICENNETCIGVSVLTLTGEDSELMNISVIESQQGKGLGKRLIQETMNLAKRHGAKSIEVGTGNSSLSQLALYQKCGFRMYAIDTGYFESYPNPIYENGIRCIDMVRLRAEL